MVYSWGVGGEGGLDVVRGRVFVVGEDWGLFWAVRAGRMGWGTGVAARGQKSVNFRWN